MTDDKIPVFKPGTKKRNKQKKKQFELPEEATISQFWKDTLSGILDESLMPDCKFPPTGLLAAQHCQF